jgi:Flp pilus assembly protein TadG
VLVDHDGDTVKRSRRHASAGQSLVEFAFIFPIITLVAFGFVDIGRAVFTFNTVTNAARQAARVASVNQLDPISGPWLCQENKPVESVASPQWTFRGCAVTAAKALGVTSSDVTISYAAPPGTTLTCSGGTLNVGCIVSVTVVAHFAPITPVAGRLIGPVTMTSTSSMPIERLFP